MIIAQEKRTNTEWRFYKFTNVTVIASLLKDTPMRFKDIVLPENSLTNNNVNSLTSERNTRQCYNDNLCVFRALALHLHGNTILEEQTSKLFARFFKMQGRRSLEFSRSSHERHSKCSRLVAVQLFSKDIDFVDGKIIGELALRIFKNYSSVKRLRYNNHICCVKNINLFFPSFPTQYL